MLPRPILATALLLGATLHAQVNSQTDGVITTQKPVQPAAQTTPQAPQSATTPAPVVRKKAASKQANAPASNEIDIATPAAPGTHIDANGLPTLRVQTRLVTVPVTVLNAGGAPVGGLTGDQFTLTEDGIPQKISLFERETTSPLSVVLAIDTSDTVLTQEKLEKDAAKVFVRSLIRPQDELSVMQFADRVDELVPFTNDVKRIDAGFGDLKRGDETAMYDAVYLASQRLGETRADPSRRRVLVIISDGDDETLHGMRYPQAVQAAQKAGVTIYPIIIVPIASDAGRNVGGEHALIQLAEDTGGKYVYVQDKKELGAAFARISDDLRTQYVLGYYPQLRRSTLSLHRIAVQVNPPAGSPKLTVRARVGYFDQPGQ